MLVSRFCIAQPVKHLETTSLNARVLTRLHYNAFCSAIHIETFVLRQIPMMSKSP